MLGPKQSTPWEGCSGRAVSCCFLLGAYNEWHICWLPCCILRLWVNQASIAETQTWVLRRTSPPHWLPGSLYFILEEREEAPVGTRILGRGTPGRQVGQGLQTWPLWEVRGPLSACLSFKCQAHKNHSHLSNGHWRQK